VKLTCPHCQGQFELAAALELAAGRGALSSALAVSGDLGRLLAQYLGMFKPPKKALSMDRAERLLAEIAPQIEGQVVLRRTAELPAPRDLWISALRTMVERRDSGDLELPLKTHGYLLKIVFDAANRGAAKQEREVETALRSGDRNRAADLRAQYQERFTQIQSDRRLKLIDEQQANERIAALKKEFGQ
jgi:hypothetical protein